MATRDSTDLICGFTEAKSHFSALMDDVVHRHRPKVIDRHKGRESMLALPTVDALEIFLAGAFTALEVAFEDDEVIVTATDLSLIGQGEDLGAALQELSEEIDDFARAYFDRFEYYRHTTERTLAPFLLRFLLTDEPQRPALLLKPLQDGQMPSPAHGRVPAAA